MISVIVPVFNEEKAVEKTLRELQAALDRDFKEYEIIAVDDGSSDRTAEMIQGLGVKNMVLIRHMENLGYGKALIDGITSARYNYVGIIDGDGSYDPNDITKLYSFSDQYDMVVGARQGDEYRRGVWKRPARKLFKMIAEYASGRKIPDVNSGLRLFKKDIVLEFRDSLCMGFSFTTTLTLLFMLNHYFVKYIPIGYAKREGRTKVNHIRDTLRVGQIIIEAVLHYNPIKLFILIASANLVFGVALAIVNFIFFDNSLFLTLVSAISIASFIPIFCCGLITDQLKRLYNINRRSG